MRSLVLLVVLVAACAPPPVTTADTVEQLENACAACVGSMVDIELAEGSRLYTTDEAICIQRGSKLTCGVCACPIVEYEYTVVGSSICEFTPRGSELVLVCASLQAGP